MINKWSIDWLVDRTVQVSLLDEISFIFALSNSCLQSISPADIVETKYSLAVVTDQTMEPSATDFSPALTLTLEQRTIQKISTSLLPSFMVACIVNADLPFRGSQPNAAYLSYAHHSGNHGWFMRRRKRTFSHSSAADLHRQNICSPSLSVSFFILTYHA